MSGSSGVRRGSDAVIAQVLQRAARAPAMNDRVIVIGASTGGTEAIKEVLSRMPADAPPILVAQHMPEGFTRSFASRLNTLCTITVAEAVHGATALPGHAYIAPGNSHLLLGRTAGRYHTLLSQAGLVNRHRPSVDMLFRSAARAGGANALGVILTGMGKDGAAGLLEMKRAGAHTFAQDEASCVVFGMPREAIALGAVHEVLPLAHIAAALLSRLDGPAAGGRKLKGMGDAAVKATPIASAPEHECNPQDRR